LQLQWRQARGNHFEQELILKKMYIDINGYIQEAYQKITLERTPELFSVEQIY